MNSLLKIWNDLRPLFSREEKLEYLKVLGLMFIGSILEVLGIGSIPAFVAALMSPEKLEQFPSVMNILNTLNISPGRELIIWGSIGLLLIFILKNLYLVWMYQVMIKLVEYHRIRLADRLFAAYMKAPYLFHLNRNSAELLRNVQFETIEIIRGILNPFMLMLLGVMMTVLTLILLVWVTPWISILALGIIGAGAAIFFKVVKKKLIRYGKIAKKERKEAIKSVNQGLGALTDARILGKEDFFIKDFYRSITTFANVERHRQTIIKIGPAFMETFSIIGIVAIIISLTLIGQNSEETIPLLVLFGAAIVRLRTSIMNITGGLNQIQYSKPSIKNVANDLFKLEGQIKKRETRRTPEPIRFEEAIRLENLTFSYPETPEPTLKNIHLEIKKGASVGFVGQTGSGKSTIVNIILGLLDPQEGHVAVDGVPIQKDLRGWLDHIGYIPQQIFLLDDTIKRNIALGIPDQDIDPGKLQKAISAAQLDDFINSLPKGIDTVVGERGTRISGGQRQRVGLARALYHNADVIVMDEATSALDNKTETRLMKALDELKEGRTFIMIAHRLSTVERCDQLFYMADGRIIASGTFQELMEKEPSFRQMASLT